MSVNIKEFDNQGSFTGFAYACLEWGWTILESWYIGDGYAAILYVSTPLEPDTSSWEEKRHYLQRQS